MHKKLFIPGPVEVRKEVLEKMSIPMIGHRSKEASELQKSISEKMRKILYTENEILLSTTSGSGLMEGAIRSCTAKRAAVFSVGAFGKRWYEMAVNNNVPVDIYEVNNGEAIYCVAAEYMISPGQLYNWLKKYQELGYNGLINKPKGRPKIMKPETKKTMPTTEDEKDKRIRELEERNAQLEMENDLLKKLKALVQQRTQQQDKKK